jgi:LysM repeat protein
MNTFKTLIFILFLSHTGYAITMVFPPTFEEAAKEASLIGIVKIQDLPKEPDGGFTGQYPPSVGVTVMTSFTGIKKGTALRMLWDSGIRLDKLMSYNSSMLTHPNEVRVTLPRLHDEYFVFLEALKDGTHRDIYGWSRKKVAAAETVATGEEISSSPSHVFKAAPFTEVPRAKSPYNRKKFLYACPPANDARTTAACWYFQIENAGDYWVLDGDTAVPFTYRSKTGNPEWPFKYTVKKGDTLDVLADKFYGGGGNWKRLLDGNRHAISAPHLLKVGIELTIPPERE